jgi:hypothetical protein
MKGPVSGTAGELNFTIEIDATRDLAISTSRVDAPITVRARPTESARTYLRLRPSSRFLIDSIAQTHPVRVDLTRRQEPAAADGAAVDIPLGSWQAETRCYRLTLRFTPDTLPIEEDLRAARIELLAETADGERERCADAAVVVRRHATPDYETKVSDGLTQVEKERELVVTMQASTSITGTGPEGEVDRRPAEARSCRVCGETTYTWDPKHCEACGERFDDGVEP